jgi:hypothetical protein
MKSFVLKGTTVAITVAADEEPLYSGDEQYRSATAKEAQQCEASQSRAYDYGMNDEPHRWITVL